MTEIVDGLIEHAELTDKRIEQLRVTQHNTNESVQALASAILDLIERITSGKSAMILIAY